MSALLIYIEQSSDYCKNFLRADINLLYRDVVQTRKIQFSDSGEPMDKEKFENITVTEKHKDTYVPFESILNVPKSLLPKESEMYYMMLSKRSN